ncbi:ArsR family transcriptional regulator [Candidatus Bathyarchaeota archaeon]|nr:ArsR family transcriptional regulator [Candidatus Bathyarchaeota archaeon]
MSIPYRVRGVKVLKAISSPIRLQVLNLLFDKGPLSYTELMNSLKMNPSRDAGRFAYHLKFLLKADLVEVDVEARKYRLTELGSMVIDVADRVEKKAFKPKSMLVRASRLAFEEFDVNRIADSLMKEAKMPSELAQKVAKEAEKRLLKSRTKYLTAPLVREVANAILIEKGLEEYRHKLTRLGLPVHEVTMLIEGKSNPIRESASIHEIAGEAILKEYMLLKVFPRDIADAHLSGALHINNLGSWTLKPREIVHDLRHFFQTGLNMEKVSTLQPTHSPPQSLESALATTLSLLLYSAKEVSETQTLGYFNIFLAPFMKKTDPDIAKETLHSFISSLSQQTNVCLDLELTMPAFAGDKPAIGPSGKTVGKYDDYGEEAQTLTSLILDIFIEESGTKPLFNPKITVKIRSETFTNERGKALLLKAHRLAADKGIVFFANLGKNEEQTVFSSSGCKLSAGLNNDWETDTLRTGCLGTVTVNLPRIAYESEKDKAKFFQLLNERLEMAARALEIGYAGLKQNGKILLPFIMQDVNSDKYFRLEASSRLINLIGLKETAESFCGKSWPGDEGTSRWIEELVHHISEFTHKVGRKHGKRLLPTVLFDNEASERLAQSDVDIYGVGKIKFSGARERPFYSTVSRLTLQDGQISSEHLTVERKLHELHSGGSLVIVELGESESKPDDLALITERLVENDCPEFFTYNRKLTYCTNCKKSWFGSLHKCPLCGSINALSVCDRYAQQ